MKKIFGFILLTVPIFCMAQAGLRKARVKSWQTFVYRINAADVEQFMRWDSIPVSRFADWDPFFILDSDNANEDKLPLGMYVLLSVVDNHVHAVIKNISNLQIITINNRQQLQLEIRDAAGNTIPNCDVYVNERKISINLNSNTYWVKQKELDGAILKVCAPNDTLYNEITTDFELRMSLKDQMRRNFKFTKTYRILSWLPSKFMSLFGKKKKHYSIDATGYIIFNQPKFKPFDTVKFKGYVVDRRWRQYKKSVAVHLNYYNKGKYYDQVLEVIKPVSPGAYVGQFIISDTLLLDINYDLTFKTGSGKKIIANKFRMEDYLLDQIGSYNFRTVKKTYFRNDSLVFYASAKDANDLFLLDAKATLLITTNSIGKIYQDTLFIPDTLYKAELKMSSINETKFIVPANILPKADLNLRARVVFKNSNNELKERGEDLDYDYTARAIIAKQEADSLHVVYLENGNIAVAEGFMAMKEDIYLPVKFPLNIKINPLIKKYVFYKIEGVDTIHSDISVSNSYRPFFSRISKLDTLGFILNNPYKIPIFFTVFDNKKVIASGKSSEENVSWSTIMKVRRQSYKVSWQYYWAGRENYESSTIGLLYKLLSIKIISDENVYPGQKDSIGIHIADYKGNPASNVNLTAVSYNNQFKNIVVKEPPYLAKYKGGRFIEREEFNTEAWDFGEKKYLLGENKEWINKFHLDTVRYYKMLFPARKYFDAVTSIESFVPQVSVNIVSNGVPQHIYLLYLNRQLVYYSGVTDPGKYAFPVYPGMAQIAIRTLDRYIELDSIYIQPNYKHDLSFDLNDLPVPNSIITTEKYWSNAEINLLENSMWQMKNNPLNNRSYVWQDSKVLKLASDLDHIVGPFKKGEMQFFNPGYFDINFNFEAGYQYDLSRQIIRLEKKALFSKENKKNWLPVFETTFLKCGDTMLPPPTVAYPLPGRKSFLLQDLNAQNYWYGSRIAGTGVIQFDYKKDSALQYIIVHEQDSNTSLVLVPARVNKIINLPAGNYSLLLVTNNLLTSSVNNLVVKANGILCVSMKKMSFIANDTLLEKLIEASQLNSNRKNTADSAYYIEPVKPWLNPMFISDPKGGSISGKIKDEKGGHAVQFCNVSIKGYRNAVTSDASGNFSINNIRAGRYQIFFSAVGYDSQEIPVTISNHSGMLLEVSLKMNTQRLTEVIVTALGQVRQARELGYSTVIMKSSELTSINLQNGLTGKVSGLNIQTFNGAPLSDTRLTLRGIRSLSGGKATLFVVDGIIVKDLLGFNPDNVTEVTVMTEEEAVAIFGSQAVNGAIMITTNQSKNLRKEFRDYAFWEPNFFTDKNGNASFEVTYPDNITGWKTFIIAMDKKRRIGKTSFITQSYKPIVAQLNLPQFLLETDSSIFIGKSLNYTDDSYSVKTTFSINSEIKNSNEKMLLPKASNIDEQLIIAENTDTLVSSFALESSTGFKDGEERKIPVFKRGIEETIGNFWVLQHDTTVSFVRSAFSKDLSMRAQNNALDVLLDELANLRRYPYACMEQTTSKLAGLAMEKRILQQLNLPFRDEAVMNKMLQKIQKAQLFDGGWPWWENGKANLYITNYIATVLLRFRENPLVETNIRNAFLYLHNQLPFLKRDELLTSLLTLSEGKHEMDYGSWINKIDFDSLSQHQQWQWLKIKQQQQMNYNSELKILLDKKIETMLGGMHWGVDNFRWYSNDVATTVIAFSVLEKEPAYKNLLPSIIQYFLEKRRNGYWANTVETASIINTILPEILQQQSDFTAPASISITGDTVFSISNFPYKIKTGNPAIKNINISKSGGGLVYFTAYQTLFNDRPEPATDKFNIQTSFQKNGQEVTSVTTGEKIKMVVTIEALKDAEYVMLKVPIPAGCTYAVKDNRDWRLYKEFYKDKVAMFIESLTKGTHRFEIELEPRYTGNYTLNPAKAELMYYPVFFGRNEMKKILIVR